MMRPNRPNFSTFSTFMPAASGTAETGGGGPNTMVHGLGPSLHFSSPSTSHLGIINPVFVDVQDQSTPALPPPPPPPPPPLPPPPTSLDLVDADVVETQPKLRPETVDRTDSASSLSSCGNSTVVTNASSTGGLIGPSSSSSSKRNYIECQHCRHFHQNHHRPPPGPGNFRAGYPPPPPLRPGAFSPYAPYPPQWYFLLAADTKKFRKHRHSHYHRDCRQCREIVRSTFEQYYLGAGQMGQAPSHNGSDSTGDSVASVSLDHHTDLQRRPRSYSASGYTSGNNPSSGSSFLSNKFSMPSSSFYRSRASCGHSCLKYTILFYCSIAIIMSICFICYLTRMFGLMREETTMVIGSELILNNNTGNSIWMDDTGNNSMAYNSSIFFDSEQPATSLLETIRTEMIGLLISSGFMIIFILGLIGAFLESVLCLRIFGAILSYLFLLTFGSALYIVILLVISHVPLKLILSTISCSAVAVTLHGLLAIAPFAFADLISEERQDELTDATNSTYFKYPSVRFAPPPPPPFPPSMTLPVPGMKSKRSYFGLGGGNNNWSHGSSYQRHHTPTTPTTVMASDESSSLPRTTPTNADNISSEGLLPGMEDVDRNDNQQQQVVRSNGTGHVRFTDAWM